MPLSNQLEVEVALTKPNPKYLRRVYQAYTEGEDPQYVEADVYSVLNAFKTGNNALDHAAKKILCSGLRGHKNFETDVKDAIQSLYRALQLHKDEQDQSPKKVKITNCYALPYRDLRVSPPRTETLKPDETVVRLDEQGASAGAGTTMFAVIPKGDYGEIHVSRTDSGHWTIYRKGMVESGYLTYFKVDVPQQGSGPVHFDFSKG